MQRDRVIPIIQVVGWVLIVGLSVIVALLWARMERQVERNQADIAAMKAYSDSQDARAGGEPRMVGSAWNGAGASS